MKINKKALAAVQYFNLLQPRVLTIALVAVSLMYGIEGKARVCRLSNGKYLGVADQLQCPTGTFEATQAPGRGFLGLTPGKQLNYEAAITQANIKTRSYFAKQGKNIKRSSPEELREIERAQTVSDAAKLKRESLEPDNQRLSRLADRNRLEENIKSNSSLSLTGANQVISSVSCHHTSNNAIWNCYIRRLGEERATLYRIETQGDSWAGHPSNAK
jgi:hypothetical protein